MKQSDVDRMFALIARDTDLAVQLWPLLREHRRRRPGLTEDRTVEDGDLDALIGVLEAGGDLGRGFEHLFAAGDAYHEAVRRLAARLPEVALRLAGPTCRRCGGSEGPWRHGGMLDEKCDRAWRRAGRPPIEAWLARSVPSVSQAEGASEAA